MNPCTKISSLLDEWWSSKAEMGSSVEKSGLRKTNSGFEILILEKGSSIEKCLQKRSPIQMQEALNVGIVSYLNVEWPSGEDMGIESGKVAKT